MSFASALYWGDVMHARLRPRRHRFRYRVFTLLLDLDELETLDKGLKLLSYNRFGLFSFHDRDHGPRDGASLKPWVGDQLQAAGLGFTLGRVRLLAMPRVLGFVFNPLSIYWCEDQTGRLRAILYEVKNTFGGQIAYAAAVNPVQETVLTHSQDKLFYVSPFIGMVATYRFRVQPPDEKLALMIRETDDAGDLLIATQTGTRHALGDRTLLKAFFSFPFMTLKVIAAIHWEALRLWLKGTPYVPKPTPGPAPGPLSGPTHPVLGNS